MSVDPGGCLDRTRRAERFGRVVTNRSVAPGPGRANTALTRSPRPCESQPVLAKCYWGKHEDVPGEFRSNHHHAFSGAWLKDLAVHCCCRTRMDCEGSSSPSRIVRNAERLLSKLRAASVVVRGQRGQAFGHKELDSVGQSPYRHRNHLPVLEAMRWDYR